MLSVSTDLHLYRTSDGSYTLRSEARDVFYHSVHGAVVESTHVFIRAGLNETLARLNAQGLDRPLDLLEVGLGTGLNMLLTWIRCIEGKCRVNYTALEPFPLTEDQLNQLAHCEALAWPGLHTEFIELMGTADHKVEAPGGFCFHRITRQVQEIVAEPSYDLIYFDAFAPRAQPELWATEIFHRLFRSLRNGGVLVTYCAKGQVRRNLMEAGFTVQRLTGPPGKQEMLRAIKP